MGLAGPWALPIPPDRDHPGSGAPGAYWNSHAWSIRRGSHPRFLTRQPLLSFSSWSSFIRMRTARSGSRRMLLPSAERVEVPGPGPGALGPSIVRSAERRDSLTSAYRVACARRQREGDMRWTTRPEDRIRRLVDMPRTTWPEAQIAAGAGEMRRRCGTRLDLCVAAPPFRAHAAGDPPRGRLVRNAATGPSIRRKSGLGLSAGLLGDARIPRIARTVGKDSRPW